jgi:trehalose-6-phosphate synthase
VVKKVLGIRGKEEIKNGKVGEYFRRYKVILGVDRLDYTKGLRLRLLALDKFFADNPGYRGKVVYLGILAPSRLKIPRYKLLEKEVRDLASKINLKYQTVSWKPINLIFDVFPREDILNFYKNADLCIVTPRDDGMNLVSKEFVLASSFAKDPGMLVLSQFAGSSIDLTASLIVNPYDIEEVARAIKKGLEMKREEKIERIKNMAEILEEKNVYEWAREFVRSAEIAASENRGFSI